ncbi:kynurenine 3-monooxygenase-like isoform X1 [Amphibalanus amphitrite]|uniref:kynurenine 3-monooxygenase-like isoform X1 n=2 Tax=Amphibalanus amphitrite TaxID=1232801 RepID=UPI001C9025D6|nr:kynurenine 3-monooxygenase-like isoform X1 [Amphibalanus amphitrite]
MGPQKSAEVSRITEEGDMMGGDVSGDLIMASGEKKVAIVGGGLVGALNACYLARRGVQVHVYEYRGDIRQMEHVPGRSINLALSHRGRSALARVGLEDLVIQQHGIPMYGRMIHATDGRKKVIPYGKAGQCIYSVGRRYLNETMLSEAETHPNVHLHFNHKLLHSDLKTGHMVFESNGREVQADADLILGCDGAYSAVRRQMMKAPRFNYSQTYIPHGYMELCIPPTATGQFAMEPNYLHIWPRGEFMMIALPNQDRTWTVTLFMPFAVFDRITTPDELLEFFRENYRDAIPLIGEEKLIKDFFSNRASPLVSVKCSPYHSPKALIMGDAAHAMVPFYGQGMNAGFEDCLLLDDLLTKHDMDLERVLPEYTEVRNPDAEAICDLAMYNYVEMRHLVNSRAFLMRKALDSFLHTFFPNSWTPLYSMVSFTRVRYHQAIAHKERQDKIVFGGVMTLAAALAAGVAYLAQRGDLWRSATEVVNEQARLALSRLGL